MTSKNEVVLCGTAVDNPTWSHENHGTQFYRFFLRVPRLSGTEDILPIVLPQALSSQVNMGEELMVSGQLRSFNNHSGTGSRLVLTVYARDLGPGEGHSCNEVELSGYLCKAPIYRRTPLGRSICDLMLAVPRRYGRADYLPVIAWGRLASITRDLGIGDPLSLQGRFQSRTYQKVTSSGTEERVAYEVSAMALPEAAAAPGVSP